MDGFSLSSTTKDHALDSVTRQGSFSLGGWVGLGVIGVFAGFVSGVAEALGDCLVLSPSNPPNFCSIDLGSVDDNLSLPVISGTCLYGLFRLFGYASS